MSQSGSRNETKYSQSVENVYRHITTKNIHNISYTENNKTLLELIIISLNRLVAKYLEKKHKIQARGVDALVIKSQYRNSDVLKGAAKRALAQINYARMLLLAPEELDAMYDALEFTNEVLQTTRCKGNQ